MCLSQTRQAATHLFSTLQLLRSLEANFSLLLYRYLETNIETSDSFPSQEHAISGFRILQGLPSRGLSSGVFHPSVSATSVLCHKRSMMSIVFYLNFPK